MKKIYNILAYSTLAIAAGFTSCKPLDKTFDDIGPKPVAVVAAPTSATLTLVDADYGILPNTNPAQTAHFFVGVNDALTSIPTILNSKYATAIDKSTVAVTFNVGPAVPSVKLIDSLYSHEAYTLATTDYTLLPGNKF